MAKHGLRTSFEMQTRDRYTKVNCELGLNVDGRELPNMEVLGGALEEASKLIQERVTESYKVVPPRDAFTDTTQPEPVPQVPAAPVASPAPVAQPAQVPQPAPVVPVTPTPEPTPAPVFRDPRVNAQ
jgi:hypothetical protein